MESLTCSSLTCSSLILVSLPNPVLVSTTNMLVISLQRRRMEKRGTYDLRWNRFGRSNMSDLSISISFPAPLFGFLHSFQTSSLLPESLEDKNQRYDGKEHTSFLAPTCHKAYVTIPIPKAANAVLDFQLCGRVHQPPRCTVS